MADGQTLLRLGDALRAWAPPLQAAAILLGLPAVAMYARRISKYAGESAHLAAATAEAAEAAKVSAITSLQTLQELQAARQAEVAPYVIAYLDVTEERRICVVVKNIGRLPARDVAIGFDPPLSDGGPATQPWETPAFLSDSIPFLPPQYELRSVLGDSTELLDNGAAPPREYQTRITYTDGSAHGTHTDSYVLDLNVFRNVRFPHSTNLSELQELLGVLSEQQQTVLDRIATVQETIDEPTPVSAPVQPPIAGPIPDQPDGSSVAPEAPTLQGIAAETVVMGDSPLAAAVAALCQQWRSLGQRQRWESAGSLQRSLRETLAIPPEGDAPPSPFEGLLRETTRSLLSHRFYLDGGESLKQFEKAVDCLLSCQKAT